MKNQYLKKLNKKQKVLVTSTILLDNTMMQLLSAQYGNPKFLCKESICLTDVEKELIFPNNLTVEGDLILNGSNIKNLPNNLIVKGLLSITGTAILFIDNIKSSRLYYERDVKFGKNVKVQKYEPTRFINRKIY